MSFVRLFVLWIAMIAVPFQAYASATMAFCAPGHAGGVAGSAASVVAVTALTAGEAAAVAHDHSMHGGDHANAMHAPDHSPSDDGGSPADAVHQCGTCGACHATALTGLSTLLLAHALPPADLVEPSVAMATLESRVPDKPPRG